MKKLLVLLAFIPSAYAAPSFRAYVDTNTAECGIFINALQEVRVPAVTVPVSTEVPTGRECVYDLVGQPNGNYTGQMTARTLPDSFGRTGVSAKTAVLNFVLPIPAGPAAPAVPQNPKLSVD